MKENAIFLGHLGLGDHIICQGIVNNLSKLYDRFFIVAKNHNVKSIEHMCSELENVVVLGVPDDETAMQVVRVWPDERILVGIFGENWHYQPNEFDKVFYEQLSIDMEQSFNWTPKDGSQSQKIIDQLCPEEDFCFVHDDTGRDFEIKLETKLPIVRNTIMSETIFDYLPLIRKAKEIHCMDSSFALMIDRSDIKVKKFLHRYLRKESGIPTYQSEWEIIDV
jgi:hypothetical protein